MRPPYLPVSSVIIEGKDSNNNDVSEAFFGIRLMGSDAPRLQDQGGFVAMDFGSSIPGPPVANLAALSAVDDLAEADFSLRPVTTLLSDFQLDKSSTATVDGISVVATLSGAGRWMRVIASNPHWTDQKDWKVSPATGNDENLGGVGFPLKTLAEFSRRVTRFKFGTAVQYDIECLDAIPSTDCLRFTGEVEPQPGAPNVFPVLLRGRNTSIYAGVTGAGCLITNPTLGVIAGSAPPNTQAIFDGGVGFDATTGGNLNPLLGKMILMANGVIAWITRGLGGTLAQVSEFCTVVDAIPSPSITLVTAASVGAGIAYDVMDKIAFGAEMISVGSPLWRYRFRDLDFTPSGLAESFTFKASAFSLIMCRIQRRPGFSATNGTFFACGVDFNALTSLAVTDGCAIVFSACGLRNIELVPTNSCSMTVQDTHNEGGYVRMAITAAATPAFGGSFVAGILLAGNMSFRGVRGYGNFNAPAGRSGVIGRRNGTMLVLSPLYGKGNTVRGAEIAEGCKMLILSTQTPIIEGAAGEVQLDGSATALPALEASAGAVLPAAAPLTTWAEWAAAPFSRNVMSYKTGAAIINASAT
jgi:hypothetical protein